MAKIEALVTGKLIRDAEPKTSKSGKDYIDMRVAIDDQTVCRCLLFGTEQRFATLRKGATIALVGALEATVYEGKVSITLLAHQALSPGIRPARSRGPRRSPAPAATSHFPGI